MDRQTIVPKGYEVQLEQWGLAPAVRVGDTVYCSGQLGIGPDGTLASDPEVQLSQAFEHLGTVLAAAGATFSDVVELTSFHVGLVDQLEAFTSVRDRYFSASPPAQTAVGVAELGLPGAIVELKATAVIGSGSGSS
jgi:enamine deaminase RidA (YjgF/YER057c/UK114 family)